MNIVMWIIGVVILVPLAFITIYLVGTALMDSTNSTQEEIAQSALTNTIAIDTSMEAYHVKLQQELQGSSIKEFISYYNDADEMLDAQINRWVQKEKVVVTDMKVFHTGTQKVMTHIMITYHPYLTMNEVKHIMDEVNSSN